MKQVVQRLRVCNTCWALFLALGFALSPLRATAQAAMAPVTFSPGQLNFGQVFLGDSATQSVTFTNTGSQPAQFSFFLGNASNTNTDFTGQTNCPQVSGASPNPGTLAAGSSCSYQVAFSPSQAA